MQMKHIIIFISFVFINSENLMNSFEFTKCEEDKYRERKNIQLPRFLNINPIKNNTNNSKILNLIDYMKENKNNYGTNNTIEILDKGKCSRSFDLENLYQKNINVLENLNDLKNYLPDKVNLFQDEFGNLITFSAPQINKKTLTYKNTKIAFLSRLDYKLFEFKLKGQHLPLLTEFQSDFVNEGSTFKKFIYLYGGMNFTGINNSDLYRIEINYLCGVANITKVLYDNKRHSKNIPHGLREYTMNVVNFSDENETDRFNINKKLHQKHLLLLYGGLKDNILSNELWTYNSESNKWKYINLDGPNSILSRKGHSSVLVNSYEVEDASLNKDLIRNFYLFIFGGKTQTGCVNDLVVLKITYMTIDNAFDYKIISPEIKGNVYPEPREGHKSLFMNESVYIFGGCNNDVGICYDDVYRLDLKNIPLEWEKMNLTSNHNEKFNQSHLYFQQFMGQVISYGSEMSGTKKFNLIINNFDCDCKCASLSNNDTGITSSKCEKEKKVVSPNQNLKSANLTKSLNVTITNNTLKNEIQSQNITKSFNTTILTKDPYNIDNYIFHDVKNIHHKRGRNRGRNYMRRGRNHSGNYFHGDANFTNKDLLKQMISSVIENSIKPLIKENQNMEKIIFSKMKQRKNSSEFEEEIKSNTNDIKHLIESSLSNNFKEKQTFSKNITNIKSYVEKVSRKSNEDIRSTLKILMRRFEDLNQNTTKIISRLEKESSKVNEELSNNLHKSEKCIDTCLCYPGYVGKSCNRVLKCDKDCNGNGECRFGKCYCNAGYEGEFCASEKLCKNNCNSNGKCLKGKCDCIENFTGEDCSLELKCLNNCNNQGICLKGNCLCEPGYYGTDCTDLSYNFKPCGDNNCNGNGLCKYEKCFCYPGHSGTFCEIQNEFMCPPYLDSNQDIFKINTRDPQLLPCNNNGICKYGRCFCYPGFKGEDCASTDICPKGCSGNGLCINSKCVCVNGYTKADCSEKDDIKLYKKMNFREIDALESKEKSTKITHDKKYYLNFVYYGMILLPIILIFTAIIFNKIE